jgi:hypothetical protein
MEWVPLPPPNSPIRADAPGLLRWWSRQPRILGVVRFQMTLTKSLAQSWYQANPTHDPAPFESLLESYLNDAAFAPRIFTVTIEEGDFSAKPCGEDSQHRYGLRLVFDKSPYPLREGFRAPDDPGISSIDYDNMDVFVARHCFNKNQKRMRKTKTGGSRWGIPPYLGAWISGN